MKDGTKKKHKKTPTQLGLTQQAQIRKGLEKIVIKIMRTKLDKKIN
jgi:hypothetical protein